MRRITELAVSLEVSPRVKVGGRGPDAIGDLMFSNGNVEKLDDRQPEMLMPAAQNPRILANARKSRSGVGPDGKPLPKSQVIALRDAIFEAMLHRFSIDPTMAAFGEENRDWGGAFAVYRGLTEALPYHRLFNTSISEGAIVGAAVGYALSGGRAVPELMYCDFLGRSGDEVFNQLCKWQAMSAGVLKMPLVLRVSVGSKYGAQHSQDWSSLLAHMPGLKVMFPVTPYDAKGMLNLALRGTDPVVYLESQRVYDVGELFVPGGVPEGYYEVEEGEPAVRRTGTDITIVTIGATLYKALETADILSSKYGMKAEVIDARFINPLRYEKILDSVRKTGRCVLASDACERGSFLHTMASTISQLAFDSLDAPVAVVGARNWITPARRWKRRSSPRRNGSSTRSTRGSCRWPGTRSPRSRARERCCGETRGACRRWSAVTIAVPFLYSRCPQFSFSCVSPSAHPVPLGAAAARVGVLRLRQRHAGKRPRGRLRGRAGIPRRAGAQAEVPRRDQGHARAQFRRGRPRRPEGVRGGPAGILHVQLRGRAQHGPVRLRGARPGMEDRVRLGAHRLHHAGLHDGQGKAAAHGRLPGSRNGQRLPELASSRGS